MQSLATSTTLLTTVALAISLLIPSGDAWRFEDFARIQKWSGPANNNNTTNELCFEPYDNLESWQLIDNSGTFCYRNPEGPKSPLVQWFSTGHSPSKLTDPVRVYSLILNESSPLLDEIDKLCDAKGLCSCAPLDKKDFLRFSACQGSTSKSSRSASGTSNDVVSCSIRDTSGLQVGYVGCGATSSYLAVDNRTRVYTPVHAVIHVESTTWAPTAAPTSHAATIVPSQFSLLFMTGVVVAVGSLL